MGLSSNTILHTTDKKGLCGILKELNFRLKYCNEMVLAGGNNLNTAFPMVSFSDFPVSELKYRDSYGRYGIGLKKAWARTNKLNPVLYVEKKSLLISYYYKQFKSIDLKENRIDNDWRDTVFHILSYMKNYQGNLKIERLKINKKNYRFSDEREWRYVPSKEVLKKHNIPSFYEGEYYSKNKIRCNQKLLPLKLPFSIKDINYIIVNRENEIEEFINYITEYHKGLTSVESHSLCSRIISMTRIKYDF
ncbi:MAG: abortive infection system antitoxin AbiGi family protein [Bacteroidia bacterium]